MPLMLLASAALIAGGCGTPPKLPSKATEAVADSSQPQPKLVLPTSDEVLEEQLGRAHVAALTEAGCAIGSYPEEQAKHLSVGTTLKHATYPPVSGEHYPDWGAYGLYDEPVDDGFSLHNLEHGGVIVWLGDEVDAPIRAAVAELLDEGEKWMVIPRPGDTQIPGLFAAAWTKGLYCSPTALVALGPENMARHLDAWYAAVVSTGSEAEKDIPAYAGAMKEPTPSRDISIDPPEF